MGIKDWIKKREGAILDEDTEVIFERIVIKYFRKWFHEDPGFRRVIYNKIREIKEEEFNFSPHVITRPERIESTKRFPTIEEDIEDFYRNHPSDPEEFKKEFETSYPSSSSSSRSSTSRFSPIPLPEALLPPLPKPKPKPIVFFPKKVRK